MVGLHLFMGRGTQRNMTLGSFPETARLGLVPWVRRYDLPRLCQAKETVNIVHT